MLTLPKNFETFNEARKKSFMALYDAKQQGEKVISARSSTSLTEFWPRLRATARRRCTS